jgi:hypothetical protein
MTNDIARALFSFRAELESRIYGSHLSSGWEWRMHPGTWIRIKADTEFAQYITPNFTNPLSATDDLIGSPVVIDAALPIGAVELRFADQMMLPMGRARA